MLLWAWGKGRKDAYFKGCRMRLDKLMALEGVRDDQLSFTIAQQKLSLQGRGMRLKRVRGALVLPATKKGLILSFPYKLLKKTASPVQWQGCMACSPAQ